MIAPRVGILTGRQPSGKGMFWNYSLSALMQRLLPQGAGGLRCHHDKRIRTHKSSIAQRSSMVKAAKTT